MQPLSIDSEKCTLCGLCLTQCSRNKIRKEDGKIFVDKASNDCIACGHCYSICPERAMKAENDSFPEPMNKEQINYPDLLHFLRSRRTHRLYQDKPVSEEHIQKLVEIARFAPTGTNSQAVRYLFVNDPKKISWISSEVMKFYKTGKRLLNYSLIHSIAGFFDKRLKRPNTVKDLNRMVERFENGEDPIFHNAPLVVFLAASKAEASTPYDDAAYAMYNMVLGAEALGLSSCLNGFSIIALPHNKKLRKALGFTGDIQAYACAGFGYPKHQHNSLVFREEAKVSFF